MKKAITTHTYEFPDEGVLGDVLAGKGQNAAVQGKFQEHISAGEAVIVCVPGMPPRAVVRKDALETLLDVTLQGADLQAIPFA